MAALPEADECEPVCALLRGGCLGLGWRGTNGLGLTVDGPNPLIQGILGVVDPPWSGEFRQVCLGQWGSEVHLSCRGINCLASSEGHLLLHKVKSMSLLGEGVGRGVHERTQEVPRIEEALSCPMCLRAGILGVQQGPLSQVHMVPAFVACSLQHRLPVRCRPPCCHLESGAIAILVRVARGKL